MLRWGQAAFVNARSIFRHKGREERTELIRFVMPDSLLERNTVIPTFKPPFDIIWRLAQQARNAGRRGASEAEIDRTALLPGVDSNF